MKPTVGRKVWYYDANPSRVVALDMHTPFDATVQYVHPDGTVNLSVTSHTGVRLWKERVSLSNPVGGEKHGRDVCYATWMPYQVEQAKLGEAKEATPEAPPRPAGVAEVLQEAYADGVAAQIVGEYYFTGSDGANGTYVPQRVSRGHDIHLQMVTFCVLVLRNGFTVTGEAFCANPGNYVSEVGRSIARQNAVDKIPPLLAYQERERLHQAASGQGA